MIEKEVVDEFLMFPSPADIFGSFFDFLPTLDFDLDLDGIFDGQSGFIEIEIIQ